MASAFNEKLAMLDLQQVRAPKRELESPVKIDKATNFNSRREAIPSKNPEQVCILNLRFW